MKYIFPFLFLLIATISNAQNPNDCVNAINLCGNTDLNIDPSGIGINEFNSANNPAPGCYNFNADQVWFKIEIEQSGTFDFTLFPEQAQADYDFAVFGPTTDCSNLGPAIRCSSTNPAAAGVSGDTGLNDTEVDLSEGPGGAGNGFLRELDVVIGETYYIIIGLAGGDGGFTMSTGGSAQLPPPPVLNDLPPQEFCDNDPSAQDGLTGLDLTQFDNALIASSNTIVRYFETANDANINANEITGVFNNTAPNQTIFIRAERTDSDCVNFGQFDIVVDDTDIDPTAATVFFCSTRNTQPINLEDYLSTIEPDFNQFTISYFDTINDAYIDANPINPNQIATTVLQSDVIKFVDPADVLCEFYATVPYQVTPPPVFTIDPAIGLYCDDDYDDSFTASLNEMDLAILNGQDATRNDVFYYATSQDRDMGQNAVTSLDISSNPQIVFTEIRNNITGCFSYGEVSVRLTSPPFMESQAPKTLCISSNLSVTLTVESGFAFYEWSNGVMGTDAFEITVDAIGDYTVTATDTNGCSTNLTISVEPSEVATINEIVTSSFTSDGNTATILVSGTGDYEFNLDQTFYQDSNEFTNLFRGFHSIEVRDKNGCGFVTEEFVILDFEPFFTPNNDGFNDTWSIEGIDEFPGAVIAIFDRYGKAIYQFTSPEIGWDGTLQGQPLPSSTYWFSLKVPDQEEVRGFFALKR